MKKMFLFLALMLTVGAFAQRPNGPTPTTPAPDVPIYEFRMYTFFKCDSNGKEITDSRRSDYVRYDVRVSVLVYMPGNPRLTNFVQDRLRDQICQTGRITEFPSPYYEVINVTRGPIWTVEDLNDRDLVRYHSLLERVN